VTPALKLHEKMAKVMETMAQKIWNELQIMVYEKEIPENVQ
jgi:hypothetical protein